MARTSVDLLQGTLDLLILKTLSWGPAHGYAIARWIEQLTGNALQIGEGSLYPSLHRLEELVDPVDELAHPLRTRRHRRRARRARPAGPLWR